MKEIEVKRCPICRSVLGTFVETGNDGGERIRETRYYCESCGTFNEEDIIKTITKKILPTKLLKKRIRKEMLNSRISDDKVRYIDREIANDFF
jgi:transposase-like protein